MRENQRSRLSKQLLQTALTDLLVDKSIHKISVREICDKAEVNRTTFYKYFGSQYELLTYMEDEIFRQVNEYLSAPGAASDSLTTLTRLLSFVGENISICRILSGNSTNPEFAEKLINLPCIKEIVVANMKTAYSDDHLDYIYDLIVNGCFAVIKSWINKENRESGEEIASLLYNLITRITA